MPAAAPCQRPLLGVAAVLMGAFISTLNTRVTTFGLADIRGGAQPRLRRGLLAQHRLFRQPDDRRARRGLAQHRCSAPGASCCWASAVFTLASLLLPFATDYDMIIALQIIRGLSVGTFIPAALGFILRSLPPRWWIWGIAAYAFRFTFSQNVAASLEAWYSETGHWEWIFWQNVVLTPLMALLIIFGVPREAINRDLLRRTDWGGHHLRRPRLRRSSMPASIRATASTG